MGRPCKQVLITVLQPAQEGGSNAERHYPVPGASLPLPLPPPSPLNGEENVGLGARLKAQHLW